MATKGENISQERGRIVNMAVAQSIEGIPALRALRASGGPGEAAEASGGYYDADDNWVTWWKAGMPVGSAPIKPARY